MKLRYLPALRSCHLPLVLLTLIFWLFITGCQGPSTTSPTQTPAPSSTPQPVNPLSTSNQPTNTATPVPTSQLVSLATASSTTPSIGLTPSLTPTATPSPTITPTPTATPIGLCRQRIPSDDDLLTIVTLTYSLSPDYEPADLLPLADYFSADVHLNYPNEIRAIVVEPLQTMIGDMAAAGMAPFIISAYRSFYSQSVAWNKWMDKEPDRFSMLSAPPGFSEHQLGTTIDFGSPELEALVGPEFEFHTYFYQTSEGAWLLENAHRYGFTLSYPREAQAITGFYYEPWHYRYVGIEMATMLSEMGLSLTEYQLINQPEPCIPDET